MLRKVKTKSICLNRETVYCSIWALYSFFYYILSVSELSFLYNTSSTLNIIRYFSISVLGILFITNRQIPVKLLIQYALFGAIVCAMEVKSGNVNLFLTYLLIIVMPQMNIKDFVRLDVKVKIIGATIIFLMCLVGITDNYVHTTGFSVKYSLGFYHPNNMSAFIFAILIEILYVKYKQMKLKDWLVIILVWALVYKIAASRTVSFVFLFVFLLFWIANYREKIFNTPVFGKLLTWSMPICSVISILLVKLYRDGNVFAVELNKMMSSRIYFMTMFMEQYDITLFGQKVEMIGSRKAIELGIQNAVLDNAYIRSILINGIIYSLFICGIFVIIMSKSLREKRIDFTLFCLYFIMIGVGESYMLDPMYNITLLCTLNASKIFYEKKQIENMERREVKLKKEECI